MKKRRNVRKESSLPRDYARAIGLLLLVYLCVTLAVTVAAFFTSDPTGTAGIFSTVALVISGALGGFITSKKMGMKLTVVGACSVAVLFSVLSCAVGGVGPGLWSILNACLYIAAVSLSARVACGGKKRIRR